ncbi:MAG: 23S rRNA (uracil(1939)-C(5))-methyltransferase RlmD [Erysipelotrichaceae bacterium]
MKKNDIYTLTCTSYTYQGFGVAKLDGFPIFISNMLMDEQCEIAITLVKKTYAFGRIITIIKPSIHRVEPICPIYKQCGGCSLQHMDAIEQANFKTNQVQSVIERIAKLDNKVEQIKTMDKPYNYRNKTQVPIGFKDNKAICGFYRMNSNDIIEMENCSIHSKTFNSIIEVLKPLLIDNLYKHILIKEGFNTKEIMVVLIVKSNKLTNIDSIINTLTTNFTNIKSIIMNVNDRKDNVILGDKEYLLYGKDYITDTLDGLKFNISAKSFYQINPIQMEVLYNYVKEFAQLDGTQLVLDLYCGVGTIGLYLARYASKVIGIEIVEDAIKDAKINAQINNANNIEFVCSDAANYACKLVDDNIKPDVIVIDPPRKGCDELTISSIVKMNPSKIVYVSCDPSTLARDLAIFNKDYHIDTIQPVDMFPHTYHVECVVLMTRK